MSRLDCALAETLIQPRDVAPLLSFFVPTYNRTPEMVETVTRIATQLRDGLETRVEIVISDNASDESGRDAVRELARRFPTVSYYMNARNEGGYRQLFMAPWRVRGRYSWTFGSDDILFPGGVADIVGQLDAHAPSFLTMNKRILNKDLSKELVHRVNGAPDHLFANFLDLFCGVGVHQVAFLSSSLERTDVARALDPTPFLSAETLHNYLIAYIAKHRYAPCYYSSANYLGHRVENADLHDYAGLTYEDIGVRFPIILMQFAKVLDLPADVFEQINGSRYINDFAPPEITYVDNMLEYMVRAISKGRPINILNKFPMEQILARCRAHRLDQFADIWTLSEEFRQMQWRLDDAEAAAAALYANLNARRNGLYDLAMTFTDKKL